ncbi:MAG: helix-turn-helix domain-containing protein [Sphingobacterium sp.]
MNTTSPTNHIGRKIGRIRELRSMKQETLANELGVSQQTVSNIEKSESIEADLLAQVASILGVTTDAIESFSEDAVITYFNTFHDSSTLATNTNHGTVNSACTFNPLDKLIEAYEENKKLYMLLVEAEKSKVQYLEKVLNNK